MEIDAKFPRRSSKINRKVAIILTAIIFPAIAFAQREIIKTYYDDAHTVLKEYYTVKDLKTRIIEGEYNSYYVNGKLKASGYYINNVPDGLWIYYYENGNIKMRGRLNGDKSFGTWKYYYENGKTSMEGELRNGTREGNWKFYYETGLTKSEGNFTAGEKSGIWNYYYEDGIIKAQCFYSGKVGVYKEFYTSGSVKMRGYQYEGRSDSLWTYYYEDGKIQAEGSYSEGLKDGPWVYYDESGTKDSEGYYSNGDKNGTWTYFHDNGNISSEGQETEGKKQGYWKLYDVQGQFIGDGTFESGEGDYKEYFPSGKLRVDGHIVNDKYQGEWLYYDEDGQVEGKCYFEDGLGAYTGYYPSGNIKMKGMIRDGKNIGKWELYNESGALTGYYKPVYEDDKPVFRVIDKPAVQDTVLQDNIKPDYYYRKRKVHYFTPVINEYRGIILATNPFGAVLGSLPFSIEYYNQERLGHEVQVNILRNPFFKSSEAIGINTLYNRGFDIAFRQKLYHPDRGFGSFYFANELRFTNNDHSFNAADSTFLPQIRIEKVDAMEYKYEYSLIIGNRRMEPIGEWMSTGKRQNGITLDIFIGIGIGLRTFEKKYPGNSYFDKVFGDLRQEKFSLSPRFGLNLGYFF